MDEVKRNIKNSSGLYIIKYKPITDEVDLTFEEIVVSQI